MGLATILSVPSSLGAGPLVLRGTASYAESGDLGLLRGLLSRAVQVVLVSSCVVGLAAACVILLSGGHSAIRDALIAGAALVPLMGLAYLGQSILQGLRRMTAAFGPPTVIRPLAMLGMLGLLALLDAKPSPQDALLLQGGAVILALLFTGVGIRRALLLSMKAIRPAFATRTWARAAVGLGLTGGLTAIAGSIGVLLAGAIGGGRDAGLLGAAARISVVVALMSWAANEAFQPVVARLYALGDRQSLQNEVTRLTRRVALVTFAVAAVVAAVAHPALTVFGPGFAHGTAALRLLCMAAVINAAASSNIALLMMTEHERSAAVAASLGALSVAIACVLLIPPLGAAGGAAAFVLGTAVRNLAASRLTWTKLGIESTIVGAGRRAASIDLDRAQPQSSQAAR
jgi:O-antigen/teichoic acid export membrane protein